MVSATPAVTPISLNTSLGGSPNKIQQALNLKTETPYDGLSVTGNRVGNTFGVNIGGDRFGAPGEDVSAFDRLTDTADPNEILVKASPLEQAAPVSAPVTGDLSPETPEDIEAAKNPMVVTGTELETLNPEELLAALGGAGALAAATAGGGAGASSNVVDGVDRATGEIVVSTPKPYLSPEALASVIASGAPTSLLPDNFFEPPSTDASKKLGLEEYLRIAGLASGLIGGAAGGGQGQTGTYGGGGTGRLNPIFSAKLPSAGGLGTIGANRTARPMGDVDWLTYGTRPELNFFDYASQNNPAPITTPIPNEPRGPSMYAPDVDNVRFAQGGSLAAKRGGPPRRTEFAVNGAGTGRSDDIPAVLSDGEYVIDAETVALLGDGSNKAGAKKLDDLRVKVRKHKGQKLAKGRFSANAKKPEAYLSGGRI